MALSSVGGDSGKEVDSEGHKEPRSPPRHCKTCRCYDQEGDNQKDLVAAASQERWDNWEKSKAGFDSWPNAQEVSESVKSCQESWYKRWEVEINSGFSGRFR